MKENIETIIEAIKKMKADVAKIHRDFIKTAEKTPHFNAGDESGY